MLADAALRPGAALISKPPSQFSQAPRGVVALCVALAAGGVLADEPPQTAPRPELSPAIVQSLTPILADWIVRSRNAALEQGVAAIPTPIRSALAGYVPDATLDRVRWRTGGGDEASLQKNVFAFGDIPAITLDYVVVFSDEKAALNDPKLWAHELKHVMQFADWSVAGFAARYLRDYEAVEKDAADYRWEFMKLRGLTPPAAPVR